MQFAANYRELSAEWNKLRALYVANSEKLDTMMALIKCVANPSVAFVLREFAVMEPIEAENAVLHARMLVLNDLMAPQ